MQGATRIRSFDPLVIHGLLQTSEYREAVLSKANLKDLSQEQLVAVLRAGRQRQTILTGPNPVELTAVIDEAALHRQINLPGVMAEQIEHLAALADDRDNRVTVQVIPFVAGLHPGLGGSFSLLEFGWPADPGFAYLESAPDQVAYLRERAKVYEYSKVFDRLSALALPVDESVEMLRDIAERSDSPASDRK